MVGAADRCEDGDRQQPHQRRDECAGDSGDDDKRGAKIAPFVVEPMFHGDPASPRAIDYPVFS